MIEIVLLYLSPYFIVFASEDSSAAISGLERTFASSLYNISYFSANREQLLCSLLSASIRILSV